MAMAMAIFSFILLLLLPFAVVSSNTTTHIVFLNPCHRPFPHPTPSSWYSSHLQSLSIDPSIHLLYSYSSSSAFAVSNLSPSHLRRLRRSPAVLHILPDPLLTLHTTRSPSFLGLSSSASTAALQPHLDSASHDVVVGVLDTGVWPESPSFSSPAQAAALPPPPARWRGECEAGVDFSPSLCNRKLIGARSFSRGFRASASGPGNDAAGGDQHEFASPRDRDGHGSHTASTVAGFAVGNASLLGYAAGTARGMAPGARVAVYKVCWATGCLGSDILAGIDAAINDGVHVLSLSLGGGAAPYFRDTIAVGAFAAAARGIFVSCSAGNSGPAAGSVANSAPWIATVGAGTLDRDFPAYATLGSGVRVTGVSLYSGGGMGARQVPIVYGGGGAGNASRLCLAGTLNPALVRGKLVLCDRGVNARVEKGALVKAAGGAGMILANTAASGEELVADSHLLPAIAVGMAAGNVIRDYVAREARPTGVLSFGGTVLGVRPSPVVAAFSSRGPNTVVPQILKPDLIGPGVNILAGWSGVSGPTGLSIDQRRSEFNIVSGTSMSCPHISGVAALLKAAHPDWSPAAIKSALMTTAYTVDNTNSVLRDAAEGGLATPYAYGSGHVDPQKALSPGLIYDICTSDYINFLCSLNYSVPHIQVITQTTNISCAKKFADPGDLNYPSFSVVFGARGARQVVKYRREVKNVGPASSVYDVKVTSPDNVNVTVRPMRLVFKKVGQKLKYSVTFVSRIKGGRAAATEFGSVTWVSKEHVVHSPVAYEWKMI